MTEIICAGFGGQGVLLSGMIIATAGMHAGKNVSWYPSYGSEMRGGTANCNIKISDEAIASPYAKNLDILLAMNEPSINKFEEKIKPGGILLINSSITNAERVYREDIQVYSIPASEIAVELDNPKGLNIIMLGALMKASGLFDQEAFKKEIDDYFMEKKGRHFPKNGLCYDAGTERVELIQEA